MNIVIYESSSFGGNYRYAQELAMAYGRNCKVDAVTLVVPRNADCVTSAAKKILMNDKPGGSVFFKKLSFIARTCFNPLILLHLLVNQKTSLVIFNDFEQVSSPFWVPLFKIFGCKYQYVVVLHDPDRDAYPPNKIVSGLTMKCILSLCQTALYHEYLPQKTYYNTSKVTFLSVPHGLYPSAPVDVERYNSLMALKGDKILISTLGNIRMEKNYEQVIRCLPQLPGCMFLVAGKLSNSSVDTSFMTELVRELGVEDRVVFQYEYLTEQQLSATIKATDICMLNYLPSFTSQSGLINLYAPFKKKVVISDTGSGLSMLNRRFSFGEACDPEDDSSCITAIKRAIENNYEEQWNGYLHFASWDRNVEIVIERFNK